MTTTIEPLAGAGHKKGGGLVNSVESGKVQVAAIHHVDRPRFEDQLIENVDFVSLARGDNDHGRNAAAQIQKRVQFDGRLVPTKLCPGKQ